jgi:hypothetical protein
VDYYRQYVRAPDAEPDLVAKANARLAALERAPDAGTDTEPSSEPAPIPPTPMPLPEPQPQPSPAPSASSAIGPGPAPDGGSQGPAASAPVASVPPPQGEGRGGSSWKTVGFVVGGAGVASVGTSLVLGALAMAKNRDANAVCAGAACSSQEGVNLAAQGGHLATASTVTFFAGLALAGAGLTIVLTAPKTPALAARTTALQVTSVAGPKFTSVELRGDF